LNFFLSENTKQYSVHPIEWKDDGIKLSIDFIVRTSRKAQPNDPVSFIYTLEKNEPFNEELLLYFVLNDTTAVAPSLVESLVSEDNNSSVRYTSQIEYGDFVKMISAKRVFSIFIGLISGLIVGAIIAKIFLGPDWQDAFASPVVIGALIGTAAGFQTSKKKKK